MLRDGLTLALKVVDPGFPVASADEVLAQLKARIHEAATDGADILVLPEYFCEQWLQYAPYDLPKTSQIAWMAEEALQILPALAGAARAAGIALLAGTVPHATEPGTYVNRAWMFFPDREPVYHDKLELIGSETDPACWQVVRGDSVSVFEWRGYRLAILVCLDIELPALSPILAREDVDLVLVPSQTEMPSGFCRVFGCARARAIELMAAVAVVGGAGIPVIAGDPVIPGYVGGAAVYLPCEMELGGNGVFVETASMSQAPEGLVYAVDVPLAAIRALRRSGRAEVWPGSWDGAHIQVRRY